MFSLKKIVKLFSYGVFISNSVTGKAEDYDQEEKDNILKNKDDWNKLMEEYSKNGCIVYTDESWEILKKIDPDGKLFPIISFIFVGSHCPGCRVYKDGDLIKIICNETNKIFSKYINISDNNQIGYKILFVLINLDEKTDNPVLTKLLRDLPPINSIPNLLFVCRNKDCVNKNCKKNLKKMTLINNYIGTYLPLTTWVKDILEDEEEGLLKKILTHSFKEK